MTKNNNKPRAYWLALDCPIDTQAFFAILPTAFPPLYGYLLRQGPGLSPFLLFPALRELHTGCGLILHERDFSNVALASQLRSAEEVQADVLIIGDPPIDKSAQTVNQLNGPKFLQWAQGIIRNKISWGVFNSLRHEKDIQLLEKFMAAGIDFVIAPPNQTTEIEHWIWLRGPELLTAISQNTDKAIPDIPKTANVVLDFLDCETPAAPILEKILFALVKKDNND